jgi:hypothetical protein
LRLNLHASPYVHESSEKEAKVKSNKTYTQDKMPVDKKRLYNVYKILPDYTVSHSRKKEVFIVKSDHKYKGHPLHNNKHVASEF